jgi:hypothetical protein
MKNSSVIFTDHWSTFPFHLFNGKKKPSQKPKPTSKVKFNSFYQTPDRVESKPMMKLLKENFGIEVDGVKTFKTDNISTIDHTSYNGLTFNLQLVENKVVLNVLTEGELRSVSYWNLDRLLKSMNSKNIEKVNKSELIRLLINGELRVKFNVSKIKDHGTNWSFKNSKSVPVTGVFLPTLSNTEEDDFFSDF